MKRILMLGALLLCLNRAGAQSLQSLWQSLFGLDETKTEQTAPAPRPMTAAQLAGTWLYSEAAIDYAGDDMLASMAVSALKGQVEAYAAKAGVVAGRDRLILNADRTLRFIAGKHSAKGTYSYDASAGRVTMHVEIGGKQCSLTGTTTYEKGVMTLLFDAGEALDAMKAAAPQLTQNENVKLATTVVENYPGIRLGARLKKR